MWCGPMPKADELGAGFPLLQRAQHATVYAATRELGAYSHHSQVIRHDGRFHAMWSNHPHGEDGPGQRVLYAASDDAGSWSTVRELFPPPGSVKPSEETGLALTAFRWIEQGGRLYAVAGCHANTGFTDFNRTMVGPVRDEAHPARARHGYASVGREARSGGAVGPVFALWDNVAPDLAFDVVGADDPAVAEVARQLAAAYESVGRFPSWDFEGRLGYPRAVEGHRLCEPTVYRARDGKCVMLLRDCVYSHRMYVSISDDGGRTWPPAEPTDIPDSPSLTTNVALDDGTILLVGNQMAPRFDNWDEVKHHKRDPLTVSVSADGYRFEKTFALRCGVQQFRVPQVRGRGGGAQYPSAIVSDDTLYVLYSMGKEDIAISWAPLADLGLE